MSTQAPQVLSRRTNGVLPAPANESSKGDTAHRRSGRGRGSHDKSNEGSNKKSAENETPKPAKTKAHNEGEKVVIRRLPPGMTLAEFWSILGTDWESGKGKVDWFSYVAGKISNDPSKPSRPSRAYVHVTRKDHILALSEAVRTSKWEDALATFSNPSLIGPPSVEIAIYKKVPSGKKRTDARQGTIDQDPEFMAFLEELANPAPPSQNIEDDADDGSKNESKVTTTPLIEYLKEKKANKAKEAAAAKSAKHARQESGTKGKGSKDDEPTKKKGRESKADKAERGPKETVKILTKKAAAEQAAEAAKNVASQIKSEKDQESTKTSRRAGIAAAARILQRDLGLSPGSAHRKARQDAAKADADTKPPSTKEATAAPTDRPASPAQSTDAPPQPSKNRPTTPTAPKAQSSGRRNRGAKNQEKNKAAAPAPAPTTEQPAAPAAPVVLLKKKGVDTENAPPEVSKTASQTSKDGSGSKAVTAPSGPKSKSGSSHKKSPTVTPDATRGFVKHANPSQGVTEALLKQALEIHGTITFVEIDKRKGFAYVDFAEHAGLVKAVSASPVSVAQGTVQVLERKDKKPATAAPASGASGSGASEKPSGRGRRGRGGGNKANATAGTQQTTPAAAAATTNGG